MTTINQTTKNFFKEIINNCSQEEKQEFLQYILESMDGRHNTPTLSPAVSAGAVSAVAPPVEVQEQKAEPPVEVEEAKAEYIPLELPVYPPPTGVVERLEDAERRDDDLTWSLRYRWKRVLIHLPLIITNDPDYTLVSVTPRCIKFQYRLRERGDDLYIYDTGLHHNQFNCSTSIGKKLVRHLRQDLVELQRQKNTPTPPVYVLTNDGHVRRGHNLHNLKRTYAHTIYNGSILRMDILQCIPKERFRDEDEDILYTEIIEEARRLVVPRLITPAPAPAPIPVLRRNLQQTLTLGESEDCPCCLEPCETRLSVCNHPICRGCRDTIFRGGPNSRKCPLCRARL